MPLTVPAPDPNPIVKTPPEVAPASFIPSSARFDTTNLDDPGFVFDLTFNGDGSILFTWTIGEELIQAYSTTSGSLLYQTSYSDSIDAMSVSGDKLYLQRAGSATLDVYTVNLDFIESITVPGTSFDLYAIRIIDGNAYVMKDNAFVEKRDGLSSTVLGEIDTGDAETSTFTIIDGNFVTLKIENRDFVQYLHVTVFDGFSSTIIEEFDIDGDYDANYVCIDTDGVYALIGNDSNTAGLLETFKLKTQGRNYVVNSGKTLSTRSIYSFDIEYPNTSETPTINDDGQGTYTVVLPGGASVPIGSLVGNFDFLFDGTNYIVMSLTPEMAQKVYAVMRTPGPSVDQSGIGFNSWRTPDTERATALFCDLRVETDGTTNGDARLEIDSEGGSTSTFDQRALADANAGAGFRVLESVYQIIPPGASYQINNVSDPTGNNQIRMLREQSL